MAQIKINCTKCNTEIKVDIKTIDALRLENNRLKNEIANYKAKIAALESMRSSRDKFGIDDLLNGRF